MKISPVTTVYTRNSAKLTDQRDSYAFSCSLFAIHVGYLLTTSDIKHLL